MITFSWWINKSNEHKEVENPEKQNEENNEEGGGENEWGDGGSHIEGGGEGGKREKGEKRDIKIDSKFYENIFVGKKKLVNGECAPKHKKDKKYNKQKGEYKGRFSKRWKMYLWKR